MPEITLDTPLERGKERIENITINKPSGSGWLRGVKLYDLLQGDVLALSIVLPRITSPALLENEIITKIDAADLLRISNEVASFFSPKWLQESNSPPASKTPGPTSPSPSTGNPPNSNA
jgi:hypothetical protein